MSEYKIYQPMKYAVARSMDILKEALNDPDYGIELKVDGASYVLAKDMDCSVHLYGDKISKKTGKIIDKVDNVPHLKKLAEDNFPKGSQVIVEITCRYNWTAGRWEERTNSKYVNSIMLSGPEKAYARQQQTELCGAYMFDILFWDGESWFEKDCIDRYNKMRELYEGWAPDYKWLSCTELITENKDEVIADWIASGEEGGVLKLLRSKGRVSAAHAVTEIGETAKRPMHTTYKIKQVDTVDVVIMGITLPDKEYKGKDPGHYPYRDEDGNPVNRLWALGMINAFMVGAYDKDGNLCEIGTVASGLDDAIRKEAAEDYEKYYGQVIEVTCMSIDKEGRSLRHPRLCRFRPDKAAESCLLEDIFE